MRQIDTDVLVIGGGATGTGDFKGPGDARLQSHASREAGFNAWHNRPLSWASAQRWKVCSQRSTGSARSASKKTASCGKSCRNVSRTPEDFLY